MSEGGGEWFSSYILPTEIITDSKNEVLIKFSTSREYLTLMSDIVIQDKSSYLRSKSWNAFLYSQLPIGFSILYLGLFIILLRNYFHFIQEV